MNYRKVISLGAVLSVGLVMAIQTAGAAKIVTGTHDLSTPNSGDLTSYESPNWSQVVAAQQLESTLSADFPSDYAGVSLADNNATINVYMTSTPNNLSSVIGLVSTTPGSVVVHMVTNSLQSLMSVQSEISNNLTSLSNQGFDLASYGTDIPDNVEAVQLIAPTNVEESTFGQQFPTGEVEAQSVPAGDTGSQLNCHTNRENDCTGFYGGDNIESTGPAPDDTTVSSLCSSGFGIQVSGTQSILTAGHCFPESDTYVINAFDNYSSCSGDYNSCPLDLQGSKSYIGAVPASGQDDSDGGTDSEYMQGEGSNDHFWTGAIGSPAEITVYDLGGVTPGQTGICSSGSYMGAVCGLKIGTMTDRCFTKASGDVSIFTNDSNWDDETNVHVCDEIDISNPNSEQGWAGDGDSGGPVYTVNGSGQVYALGIINYGDGLSLVNCASNQSPEGGNRNCYQSGDYVSLNAILQAFPGHCLSNAAACLYCTNTDNRCAASPS